MYVKYYMTPSPITISPQKKIEEARQLLENYHFRHLPVVDDFGVLQGMVTDRDLRSAYPSSMLDEEERQQMVERVQDIPVVDIMSLNTVVLTTLSTLDDAFLLFEKRTVGALPVVNDRNQVVGIMSFNDVMKAWRSLFGLGEKGSVLVAIEVTESSRSLNRLVKVLEETGVNFTRLIRTDGSGIEPAMIYLRINTFNVRSVYKTIEEVGFKVHHPTEDTH